MGSSVSLPEALAAPNRQQPFQAVVAGATGASGRWVVRELLEDEQCKRVIALTRRPLDAEPRKFFESEKIDKLVISAFDKFPVSGEFLPDVDKVAVVAMGSAPWTEENDYTAPVDVGRRAREFGISRCALVSAVGASAGSMFGYVDTLGRREEAFKAMQFPEGLAIFRPKLLLRQDKRRTKEKLLECISPHSQCIDTRDMAKVILKTLKTQHLPVVLSVEHAEMKQFLVQ